VLVCVLGGWLVVQRAITIGDVQAFVQYIQTFTQPLGELGAASNMMQGTIAAAERVFEFLDEEEEVSEVTNSLQKTYCEGKVSFQSVRFGYNPEKTIINDFSAEIAPGQTVAIVGPTGAGKTTVVKLLMRFYELNSGKILIDGIDSTDFTREELRHIFGMVLQDTWIYNASIMDNIRYGSPNATDEEVIAAAKAAHCHKFIKSLPGGYNMMLNEEASNISQGQKQLFTIARVILKNPTILILDEATSSIDTRTEILIQKTMKDLMQGRTSFVIAHRLSTIRNADMILVMKEGDIIEKGSHDELIAAKGFYADLYNSQFSDGVVGHGDGSSVPK
jgi:ATP-binding cassette subfamily B protein